MKAFVRHFAGHAATAAWELANECNGLAPADHDEAFAWTAMIADAVQSADPMRPVASGMHCPSVARDKGRWTIEDQAESCDLLTTRTRIGTRCSPSSTSRATPPPSSA